MIAENNISLKVPFSEKDQAKALGARWDAQLKHWYIPQGLGTGPFEKWFTSTPASAQKSVKSSELPVAMPHAETKTHDQPIENDIDAINAKLRDAYENREYDVF